MDGLRGTLGFLKKAKEKYVLLGRSYVICNADFQDMLDKTYQIWSRYHTDVF